MRDLGVFVIPVPGPTPIYQDIPLVGSFPALAAVRFYNYSPYTLFLNIAGQTPIITPQTRDIIEIDPQWDWDGHVQVGAGFDLVSAQNVSQILRMVGFGYGETIPGSDPSPIVWNEGSQTAEFLENNGLQGPATPFIESYPNDQTVSQPSFFLANDGTGSWDVLSANVMREVVGVVRGDHNVAKATVTFGDTGDSSITTLYGKVDAPAPVKLYAGFQETGYLGFEFTATAGAQFGSCGVNFKTLMSNVPTSLTLTAIASANVANTFARFINAEGFFFSISSAAAGDCYWYGTYTTVGN